MGKAKETRRRPAARNSSAGPIMVGVALAIAALIIYGGTREAAAAHHPDPAPNATAEHVAPADRYAAHPRIAAVYGQAAEIPHVLDGLYCHCDCSKHAGHRSLLECFESDHGANCDVCLGEAELAYRLTLEGKTLDEVRAAIDRAYGGG